MKRETPHPAEYLRQLGDAGEGPYEIARAALTLSALDHRPPTDAEVLLRVQNNVKLHALRLDDGARAIEVAQRMLLVAPRRAELWMDLGHLNEEQGALGAARTSRETCLSLTKSGTSLQNAAALFLQGLKRRLN